ncbi:hypothetical protein [Nocardia sp. BMG111209]|uniref:hypothetical protein n=1 Tax=Nocardia sp. BMG111209 TaxID=1160137 RepID=UPI00035F6914|nr:hypothetical protein [Nocardia sp. BMG111209]
MTTAETSDAGDGPHDIPAARNPALDRLDTLVGRWRVVATFPAGFFAADDPPVTRGGGATTFEWLDGRHFLLQRFTTGDAGPPSGIAVIGLDPDGLFRQHYYDSRGVARVYHMSVADDVWRLWRLEPGFSQRFTGRLAAGGARIDGLWERSADGESWDTDFELSYECEP